MFLEQLVRLVAGLIELGLGLILLVTFMIGIVLLAAGSTTIGLLVMCAVIWYVVSAVQKDG